MKNFIVLLLTIFCLLVPTSAVAESNQYEVVSKLSQQNITLYAKHSNDLYRDFKIDFKGKVYSRPFWISVANNPTYAPKIYYEDINKDKNKELIIVLNKGYGTGLLQEEAYVYRCTNGLIDVLVDNPLAIINKNVKTKLTSKRADIRIDNKAYSIDITPLEIKPTNIFEDIAFGNITDYEVKDNQLVVRVSGQISPASSIGEIVIVYEYRDKMYQAKSIKFQPYK
jgi:hypothetical protein